MIQNVKFLIFSDLHYQENYWDGGTWEDLKLFQRRAEEENCDFIIHAGDFCHGLEENKEYIQTYNDCPIPSYHCLGNHDTDYCPLEEVLRRYNMPAEYYFFDCKGYRVIVMDPNYYYYEGQFHHLCGSVPKQWRVNRDWIPPEQLSWLKETLESSPYPCVIISHESFERVDGVQNREEVLTLIDAANRRKPGSVLLCINGHYHRDNIRILNNVCYLDLNSASFQYINAPHHLYTGPSMEYPRAEHTLVYDDPLHAIIQLEGNTVTIQGVESTMHQGITPEMTDEPVVDRAGRVVRPVIQSAKITLG